MVDRQAGRLLDGGEGETAHGLQKNSPGFMTWGIADHVSFDMITHDIVGRSLRHIDRPRPRVRL